MYRNQSWTSAPVIVFIFALCFLATSCSARNQEAALRQAQYRQGKDIFSGKESIAAKIAGHQDRLPPQVARCINCHAPAQPGSARTESAPSLSSEWLLQTRARRGGPAFAYGRESFCTTLRSGVDPEHVILNRAMPRFDISNEQCLALWLYLTEKRGNE